MNTTAVGAAPAAGETAQAKARKAGAQFEAILLNNVLGGMERAFTELPGGRKTQSTEAYSGLAMQALASAIAEGGGIGLGTLITKALGKLQSPSTQK